MAQGSGIGRNQQSLGQFAALSGNLEKAAISFVTLASAASAFFGSIQAFRELQRQLVLTNSVAQGTAVQLERMEDAVRDLALVTRAGASEAANALYFLASAGFSVEESMSALNGVVLLSQATLSNLEETSDAVASAIRAFGLQASDAGRIANVFAATITQTQATLPKLSFALRQVGPVAGVAGQSIEQVSAALGILFNVGLRGEQAGTSLRNVMVRLAGPTGEARDILRELGIATVDTNNNLRDLNDIVVELAAANLSEGVLKRIFGDEALAGISALIENVQKTVKEVDNLGNVSTRTANKWRELEKNITGTQRAMDIAIENLQTFDSQAKLATNALTELGITIGEVLGPAIEDNLLRPFTDAVRAFRDLDEETKNYIISFGLMVVAIGGGVAILGGLVGAWRLFLRLPVVGTIGKWRGALAALAVSAKSNPMFATGNVAKSRGGGLALGVPGRRGSGATRLASGGLLGVSKAARVGSFFARAVPGVGLALLAFAGIDALVDALKRDEFDEAENRLDSLDTILSDRLALIQRMAKTSGDVLTQLTQLSSFANETQKNITESTKLAKFLQDEIDEQLDSIFGEFAQTEVRAGGREGAINLKDQFDFRNEAGTRTRINVIVGILQEMDREGNITRESIEDLQKAVGVLAKDSNESAQSALQIFSQITEDLLGAFENNEKIVIQLSQLDDILTAQGKVKATPEQLKKGAKEKQRKNALVQLRARDAFRVLLREQFTAEIDQLKATARILGDPSLTRSAERREAELALRRAFASVEDSLRTQIENLPEIATRLNAITDDEDREEKQKQLSEALGTVSLIPDFTEGGLIDPAATREKLAKFKATLGETLKTIGFETPEIVAIIEKFTKGRGDIAENILKLFEAQLIQADINEEKSRIAIDRARRGLEQTREGILVQTDILSASTSKFAFEFKAKLQESAIELSNVLTAQGLTDTIENLRVDRKITSAEAKSLAEDVANVMKLLQKAQLDALDIDTANQKREFLSALKVKLNEIKQNMADAFLESEKFLAFDQGLRLTVRTSIELKNIELELSTALEGIALKRFEITRALEDGIKKSPEVVAGLIKQRDAYDALAVSLARAAEEQKAFLQTQEGQAQLARDELRRTQDDLVKNNELTGGLFAGMQAALLDLELAARSPFQVIRDEFKLMVTTMSEALTELLFSGFSSFKQLLDQMALEIAKRIIQEQFQRLITGLVNSFFGALGSFAGAGGGTTAASTPGIQSGPRALGDAFNQGRQLTKYASGGVVDQPTLFGIRGGGTGLMGEAGPEAILPLQRDRSGRLGVTSSGPEGNRIQKPNVIVQMTVVTKDGNSFRKNRQMIESEMFDAISRANRRNA